MLPLLRDFQSLCSRCHRIGEDYSCGAKGTSADRSDQRKGETVTFLKCTCLTNIHSRHTARRLLSHDVTAGFRRFLLDIVPRGVFHAGLRRHVDENSVPLGQGRTSGGFLSAGRSIWNVHPKGLHREEPKLSVGSVTGPNDGYRPK